jgi:hypothetical protein
VRRGYRSTQRRAVIVTSQGIIIGIAAAEIECATERHVLRLI